MKMITIILLLNIYLLMAAQPVRNFRLDNVKGGFNTFGELKGENLTLIDFWASWCKPCTKAIPELNKLYQDYKEKGVEIIGINCDGPRSIAKVAPLVSALQISYPVLLDMNSDVKNELNLAAFPTLIIVNRQGEIIWVHEGFLPGDEKLIRSEINKYLDANQSYPAKP